MELFLAYASSTGSLSLSFSSSIYSLTQAPLSVSHDQWPFNALYIYLALIFKCWWISHFGEMLQRIMINKNSDEDVEAVSDGSSD